MKFPRMQQSWENAHKSCLFGHSTSRRHRDFKGVVTIYSCRESALKDLFCILSKAPSSYCSPAEEPWNGDTSLYPLRCLSVQLGNQGESDPKCLLICRQKIKAVQPVTPTSALSCFQNCHCFKFTVCAFRGDLSETQKLLFGILTVNNLPR